MTYPDTIIDAVARALPCGDLPAEFAHPRDPICGTAHGCRSQATAAVNALVAATGGSEHVVRFFEENFTLQHPLTERLDGSLFDCRLHHVIAALDEPPELGEHRVWIDRNALRWEPIS